MQWHLHTASPHRTPYLRSIILAGFAEFVSAAGGDPRALVEKAGLSRHVLFDPDELIPWPRFGMLTELAADELDKPSFGLEWALAVPWHFPNLGPATLIMHFAKTFREWLEMCNQHWRYHNNSVAFQLIDDGAGRNAIYRFHYTSLAPPARQQMEYMLGSACRVARVVTGRPDENPIVVRFQHARPCDTAYHDELFRCPLEFSAPHYEMVFDRALLDLPASRGDDSGLRTVLDQHIRHRLRHMPLYDQTMATMTAAAIRSVIGTGYCTAEFVARSLGLSGKKLQRLLAQEGTSFSDILDDIRRSIAMRLLTETDVPIAQISGILDYSTTAPFTLAFKRWTGQSPRAFRKGLLAAPADMTDDPGEENQAAAVTPPERPGYGRE